MSTLQVLSAKEHGLIPIRVTDSMLIRRDLLKHAYVHLRTGEKNWSATDTSYSEVPRALFAGSMAGLLPLSRDISVLVEPRFPASLTQMVNAIGRPTVALDILRNYRSNDGTEETADWMLDRIAIDFVGAVDSIVRQGLQRRYVERRASTTSPKGRILLAPTLSKQLARGIDYRAEIAYHEKTDDTPPNQAILEGLHWVLQWFEGRREHKPYWHRTVALIHTFRYVPRDREGHYKRDQLVRYPRRLPESRSAYRRAIPLAIALAERRGFSLDAAEGDVALSSLLVKTDDVFEDFVRLRLRQYLPDASLRVVDGNTMPRRLLYRPALPKDVPEGSTVLPLGNANIQPDILIEDDVGTRLVVDVKYKPVVGHADRAEVIEQLITYAHRLSCDRAVSVHPTQEGQQSGLYVSGRVGTTTLYNYRVSIGALDLENEMLTMAESLAKLC